MHRKVFKFFYKNISTRDAFTWRTQWFSYLESFSRCFMTQREMNEAIYFSRVSGEIKVPANKCKSKFDIEGRVKSSGCGGWQKTTSRFDDCCLCFCWKLGWKVTFRSENILALRIASKTNALRCTRRALSVLHFDDKRNLNFNCKSNAKSLSHKMSIPSIFLMTTFSFRTKWNEKGELKATQCSRWTRWNS